MAASAPSVKCEQVHAALRVADLEAARKFYVEVLGFQHNFTYGDRPSLVGIDVGGLEIHLKSGTPAPSAAEVYFVLDDVDALYEFQRSKGAVVSAPPADKEWGMREYSVRDLDGYRLAFGKRLPSGGPKIAVEREEITVRFEKRLAAVVRDLAAHKSMTVGECLEETILHSFEKLPSGGLASPHTEATLGYIQELKRAHGIDYEAHDAYRFVEKT